MILSHLSPSLVVEGLLTFDSRGNVFFSVPSVLILVNILAEMHLKEKICLILSGGFMFLEVKRVHSIKGSFISSGQCVSLDLLFITKNPPSANDDPKFPFYQDI